MVKEKNLQINIMTKITKEQALFKFFHYRKILESFTKNKAPEILINQTKKLYAKAVSLLKTFNINAEEYIKLPQGTARYLEYCVDEEQIENTQKRCGRCLQYFMRDTEPEIGCEIYGDEYSCRILCKEFEDTGMSFEKRIQKLAIDRCFSCKNIFRSKNISIPDDQCLKKCNRINPNCTEFERKKK